MLWLLCCAASRFFRVDLDAECPFWDADGYCTIRDCGVDEVGEATAEALSAIDFAEDHDHERLQAHWPSPVDSSWTNEEENTNFHYVNLLLNPERYTGYRCEAGACHVWHQVHAYVETPCGRACVGVANTACGSRMHHHRYNTFHPGDLETEEATASALEALPVEHRVFYKLVSGLHASISSHIAVGYLLDKESGVWGLDLDQYERRLAQHPERLNNLHFLFLVLLHALDIVGDDLLANAFATGHPEDDARARDAMQRLLATRSEWPLNFDEEMAFGDLSAGAGGAGGATGSNDSGGGKEALLMAFRERFFNISRVMDCVGCQRCRLWGKLQVMGLGTALRLLYAPDRDVVRASLQRNHIVALLNGLGRVSHSIEAARLVVPLLQHCDTRGLGLATPYGADEDEDEATVQHRGEGGTSAAAGAGGSGSRKQGKDAKAFFAAMGLNAGGQAGGFGL